MDAVSLVYQALSNNETLINLLGGRKNVKNQKWQRVYDKPKAPYTEELPRITMFEVINTDDVFADDEPEYSDINVRIDLWLNNHNDLYVITKKIKKTLRTIDDVYRIVIGSTLYENDTGIYHKPIDVYLFLEQEDDE